MQTPGDLQGVGDGGASPSMCFVNMHTDDPWVEAVMVRCSEGPAGPVFASCTQPRGM